MSGGLFRGVLIKRDGDPAIQVYDPDGPYHGKTIPVYKPDGKLPLELAGMSQNEKVSFQIMKMGSTDAPYAFAVDQMATAAQVQA